MRVVHPEIHALAERVARLSVSRHDPEAFFAERSDIAAELHRLAGRIAPPSAERAGSPPPTRRERMAASVGARPTTVPFRPASTSI